MTGASTRSTLWGRRLRLTCSLAAGSFSETDPTLNAFVIDGGDGPANPGLRVSGKITKTNQKAPNTYEVTIYNLSQTTRAQLSRQKGIRVLLEAGYVDTGLSALGVMDVRTVDHVWDGADWRTVMKGGDGERSLRYARASESFAAGTQVGDVVRYCASSMGLALGNTEAQAAKLTKPLQHGWTAHCAASTALEAILRTVGYFYSIQGGTIYILAANESLAQLIPDITPQTGLIGSPEMGTPEKKGQPGLLKYREFLRPQALPGGRAHVKSDRYDGVFKDKKVEHTFDTRGDDWYTDHFGANDPNAQVA